MKNNNKQSSSPTTSTGVISTMVTHSISESEIEMGISVPNSIKKSELDVIKGNANNCFIQSLTQKYKAIAYAYIWYHKAKHNTKYLEQEMAKMDCTHKSKNAHYLNALKCCFSIKGTYKASSVSQYAKVMQFIEEKFGSDIDHVDIEQHVDDIAKAIKAGGGLEQCASNVTRDKPRNNTKREVVGKDKPAANTSDADGGPSTTKKPDTPKKSKDYIDLKMREYAGKAPLGSFSFSKSIEKSATGLVVMVGRINKGQVDVVHISADDNAIERLIKVEGKAVAAIKGPVN